MLRQSLIAAVCACFHPLDATGRRTDTRTTQHRTIAHRVYTYDPVPNASLQPKLWTNLSDGVCHSDASHLSSGPSGLPRFLANGGLLMASEIIL